MLKSNDSEQSDESKTNEEETDKEIFVKANHPQHMFIPKENFADSQYLKYNLEKVLVILHLELVFNDKLLLLLAKYEDKKYRLCLVGQPCLNASSFVPLTEFILPIKTVVICFALHCGCTIIILGNKNGKYMLHHYKTYLEGSYTIEHLNDTEIPGKYYFCPLTHVKNYVIENSILAFSVEKYQFSGPLLIYIYKCTAKLSFVCCIDISIPDTLPMGIIVTRRDKISSMCFLDDCKKLALVTSSFQYIEFNLDNIYEKEKPFEQRFLSCKNSYQQNNLGHLLFSNFDKNIWLNKVSYKSKNKEFLYILTTNCFVYNVMKNDFINLGKRLKKLSKTDITVWNSQVCDYNKCLYIYVGGASASHILCVYEPLRDEIVNSYDVQDMYYSNTFTINWFGNQMYRAGVTYRKEICIRDLSQNKCLPLQMWAKLALFQKYSLDDIMKMGLGKVINYCF